MIFDTFLAAFLMLVIVFLTFLAFMLKTRHRMFFREKELKRKGITFLDSKEWHHETLKMDKQGNPIDAQKVPSRQWYKYLAQKTNQ